MRKSWRTYALLVALMICWGNAFVAIKYALRFVTPLELMVLRYSPVALMYAAVLFFTERRRFLDILRRDWLGFVVLGFLSVEAYNFCLYFGETEVSAGTAGLIVGLSPSLTFVLSMMFLRERPSSRKIVGLAISFGGLAIVIGLASGDEVELNHLGAALVTFGSSLAWALYNVAGKPLAQRHPPLTVAATSTLMGSIPLMVLLGSPALQAKVPRFDTWCWLSVAFLSIVCTFLAMVIYLRALGELEATRACAFVYLVPLVSVVSDCVLLGQEVTLGLAVGGTLLVAGVAITNYPPNAAEPQPKTFRSSADV